MTYKGASPDFSSTILTIPLAFLKARLHCRPHSTPLPDTPLYLDTMSVPERTRPLTISYFS